MFFKYEQDEISNILSKVLFFYTNISKGEALMYLQRKNQHCIFNLSSVADPDPGSGIGCFLTPGSGIRDPE